MNFVLFRICLGTYFFFNAIELWPYLLDLYSAQGMLPQEYIPSRTLIPRAIFAIDFPWLIRSFGLVSIVAPIAILLGYRRRLFSFLLFLVQWFFFQRNPLADSPELAFMNWLLLLLLLIPEGEAFCLKTKKVPLAKPKWQIPEQALEASWALLALGYTYSGLTKLFLGDASWKTGAAIFYILKESIARRLWYESTIDNLPAWLGSLATWSVLALQITSIAVIIFPRWRKIWWLSIATMHIAAMVFLQVNQISLGMLLFQLLLWDLSWWENRKILVSSEISGDRPNHEE